ncbi:MAG: transcriptional regulator, partial [Firmicutes bacterium]|nr:transcriptional regulator [Bacillota bacterium]
MLTINNAKEMLEQVTQKAELLKAISHPVRLC